MWKGIIRNMKEEDVASWIKWDSFRWIPGKGDMILFWVDCWCGTDPLRVLFPWLYRLARNKVAVVWDLAKDNHFRHGKWEDVFSRKLLDREMVMLEEVKRLLIERKLNPCVEDRIIWVHDKTRSFTVKQLSQLLSQVEIDSNALNYDRLWKLKVPPKVQCFIWMLLIDRLPSKDFLRKRGIQIPDDMSGCSWCGLVNDSVWCDDPIQSTLIVSGPAEQNWIPPSGDMVKFSVDGAATSDKAGCGGVLRDAHGVISIMFSGPLSPLGSEFAELGAILKALELFRAANWIGRAPLIVESDAKLILNWLSEPLQRSWRWWKIFRDIDDLVTQIGNIQFQHICREKNVLADYLAKAGLQRSHSFEAWW
ncbi:hypothetical protein V6N13_123782 [Hibiscus sabdariffa]